MGQALLQLLPLALAAALRSVPITATIFILLSESRSRCGLGFLAGTVLGTFATVALAAVAGHALPGRPREHDALVAKVEVVIGVALVLLGVVTLVRRSRAASGSGPGWMNSIGTFGVLPVFGIGVALNLRPKAILLAAAAGLAIVGVDLVFHDSVGLVVFYTAIATCTVGVPILATILFPRWAEPRLVSAKGWITAHSSTVGATMMIVIGGFVIGLGVSG